jgi:hypothetical protein
MKEIRNLQFEAQTTPPGFGVRPSWTSKAFGAAALDFAVKPPAHPSCTPPFWHSDLGFLSDFGFRISGFFRHSPFVIRH